MNDNRYIKRSANPTRRGVPLRDVPKGIALLGKPSRWLTYLPALAPKVGDLVILDGAEFAVADTYLFTDPGQGKRVSVGVVQLTVASA